MRRETIPHAPIPAAVAKEARDLMEQCDGIHPYWGGTGCALTGDPEIAKRFAEGWAIDVNEDTGEPIVMRCLSRSFQCVPGGPTRYDINLAPALVEIAREIIDGRKAKAAA